MSLGDDGIRRELSSCAQWEMEVLECCTLYKAKVNEIQLLLLLTDAEETAFVLWQQLPGRACTALLRRSCFPSWTTVLGRVSTPVFHLGRQVWVPGESICVTFPANETRVCRNINAMNGIMNDMITQCTYRLLLRCCRTYLSILFLFTSCSLPYAAVYLTC